VSLLFTTHPLFLDHDTGPGHPERPARLEAVLHGLRASGLDDALVRFEPQPAPLDAVERVHPGRYRVALEEFSLAGGGSLDGDTVLGEYSYEAAMLAAGAGLEAVRLLESGLGDAAFCAVRPPGHHATPRRAMGFCLINNVAVVAAELAARGQRVLVVDYDAHHGNGTQDAFYDDDRVVYVSMHEYPLYPGTGSLMETGEGRGSGATINVPVPSGTTGDVYRRAVDEVVAPMAAAFQPDWLLLSAGFDAHRRDPITGLGLASGDFADLTADLAALVPAGRRVVFLEGGYDLEALADSSAAACGALLGVDYRPEPPTAGGPGTTVVDAVRRLRDRSGWA
jgi:acetoin utilization deacetylase AcuC-like enzyme